MADGSKSSRAVILAPWVRWALPSVADVTFIALLGALLFTPLAVRLLSDAGIGWHIRAGQQILATHAIPHVDPFSSTMSAKPWFAWEWLYDVIVGELDAKFGLNGVVWFTAIVIGAVFALLFRVLVARGTSALVALVFVLLAMSASMIHFLARPHVVSWLFTLVWFWVLDSSERESAQTMGKDRWVWALPLLMLAWVNLHGGFVIGFVLLGIFWLAAVWTWFGTKEGRIEESLTRIAAGKRAWNLVLVGVLSAIASLGNPYGWRLHAHIFSYLSNSFLMDHIDEFQSPNFHRLAQKFFLALLLVSVAALAVRGRDVRISGVLTELFAVYAGLYASRNIPIASILLAIVIAPLIGSAGVFRDLSKQIGAVESRLRGHAWPVGSIVIALAIVANGGRVGSNQVADAHFDPARMPVSAVDYIADAQLKGPALTADYWGGYLVYRLYPETQVVVDDRHDLYGEDFLKHYLKMIHAEPGWVDFLSQHDAGYLLLPRSSAIASLLLERNDWESIYEDDVAVVFVRTSGN